MTDDDLITLADACERVFGGKIKVATLRAEIGRGNLTVFRVGRRHFTTARHLREMVAKCRVAGLPQGYTSIASVEHGQSETERISSARAALSLTLKELKGRSGSTLVPSTNRNAARRH
jgi:hypothetical protein